MFWLKIKVLKKCATNDLFLSKNKKDFFTLICCTLVEIILDYVLFLIRNTSLDSKFNFVKEICQHEILEFVKKRNFRIRWMLDPMKSTFYILFWTLRHLKKEWLKKTRQMEDKKKNPRPPRSTMVGISKFWPEIVRYELLKIKWLRKKLFWCWADR